MLAMLFIFCEASFCFSTGTTIILLLELLLTLIQVLFDAFRLFVVIAQFHRVFQLLILLFHLLHLLLDLFKLFVDGFLFFHQFFLGELLILCLLGQLLLLFGQFFQLLDRLLHIFLQFELLIHFEHAVQLHFNLLVGQFHVLHHFQGLIFFEFLQGVPGFAP